MRITFIREKGWFGYFRSLTLHADDYEIGAIKGGETKEIDVPEDAEHVFGRMDWGQTNRLAVSRMAEGDEIIIRSTFRLSMMAQRRLDTLPISLTLRPGRGKV